MNEFYRRQFRRSQIAPGQLVRDNMTAIVRGRFALSLRAFYARIDAACTTRAGSELSDLKELSTQFCGPSRNFLRPKFACARNSLSTDILFRAAISCERRSLASDTRMNAGRTADTRVQSIPFSDGPEYGKMEDLVTRTSPAREVTGTCGTERPERQ